MSLYINCTIKKKQRRGKHRTTCTAPGWPHQWCSRSGGPTRSAKSFQPRSRLKPGVGKPGFLGFLSETSKKPWEKQGKLEVIYGEIQGAWNFKSYNRCFIYRIYYVSIILTTAVWPPGKPLRFSACLIRICLVIPETTQVGGWLRSPPLQHRRKAER